MFRKVLWRSLGYSGLVHLKNSEDFQRHSISIPEYMLPEMINVLLGALHEKHILMDCYWSASVKCFIYEPFPSISKIREKGTGLKNRKDILFLKVNIAEGSIATEYLLCT